MKPPAIYSPKTTNNLQNWVKERIQSKQPFAIRGTNSRFSSEATPILSTRNLKELLFFNPEDMVIGVQAGISAEKLQQCVNEKKMFLPINPWYPHSSIGSVVACNDFGPNRMNGGGLRDCIIGIEYINGKGEWVKAGGRVVKNVTGYDLSRMMLGSLGGLGVIVAINFKTLPQPTNAAMLLSRFENDSWRETIRKAHENMIPLDWIETITTNNGWAVGVGFSGNPTRQDRIVRELRNIFTGDIEIVAEHKKPKQIPIGLGKKRCSGFLSPLIAQFRLSPEALHLHITLSTRELLTQINFQPLTEQGVQCIVHPIGADFHLFLDDDNLDAQKTLLSILKNQLSGSHAKISWVKSKHDLEIQDFQEVATPKAYAFMQALKHQLDPFHIFHAPFYNC